MGRPALDERAIDAFREQLSALAMRRFAEEGYRAVTLRGLARELGVSHAMMYRYVADKDDLFADVRRRCLLRFIAYQEQRLSAHAEPLAALREGARSYVDFAIDEPDAFRVMFDPNQPELSAHPELKAAHGRAFRLLERIVRTAIEAGRVHGEARTVSEALWAAIHGVATLYVTGQLRSRRAAQTLSVTVADALLAGFAGSAP